MSSFEPTDSDPFEYPGTDLESPHANQPADTLEHVHVRNGTGPDELLVIPTDATEAELATVWMQANGDAFTDLDDAR